MDNLRDAYEAAGQAAIDKIKLTDAVTFEVSMGIVPDPQNGGIPAQGWWMILQLRHNKLLGQPPIVGAQAVASTNISLEFIGRLATEMLEQARAERDKMNATPVQSQGLPAGLVKR